MLDTDSTMRASGKASATVQQYNRNLSMEKASHLIFTGSDLSRRWMQSGFWRSLIYETDL